MILRESTALDQQTTPGLVPALEVVEELNRKRDRLQTLEESLESLANKNLREVPRFPSELKGVDTALEEMDRSMTRDMDLEGRRTLALQVMRVALEYWTESTGTTKFEMARQSKLWHVYTNRDGWERTQTQDQYPDPGIFPKRPRMKKVITGVNDPPDGVDDNGTTDADPPAPGFMAQVADEAGRFEAKRTALVDAVFRLTSDAPHPLV